ncbi:MAG: methyltransferase domain-containing protein [Burkholderiales bacterium]|nr:MAG: methyltransferase domain-containing protein [Burkholderiales bacterium]
MHDPADNNRRTVQAYDAYAERYAEVTKDGRTPTGSDGFDIFLARLPEGGRILEVASGPGWDADMMEARGFHVRRTDVSEGFIVVQARRNRLVEKLDLIADDLGGPYDGLVALYVVQHIPRDQVADLLERISHAIAPKGAFLFSFQIGEGERIEKGESGDYHIVMWKREDMEALITRYGLQIIWSRVDDDTEGRWVSLVAVHAKSQAT